MVLAPKFWYYVNLNYRVFGLTPISTFTKQSGVGTSIPGGGVLNRNKSFNYI